MADETNPNAAAYAREEERRTKLKAWLEAGAPRPTPLVTAATTAEEDLAPHMTQINNDLAVLMATGADVPADGGAPGAPGAPVNRDVPHVTGTGAVGETLSCTMGNWDGEPTGYAYQWKRDGTVNLSAGPTYAIVTADAGHSLTCVVTATNANGSTAAPPSNAVAVAAAARTAPAR